MKPPKDLFSAQAAGYKKFRPIYPPALYRRILQEVKHTEQAWDCATGNGQVALELANYFKEVNATDISQAQLDQAETRENIHYSISRAEQTNFPDSTFDLITVAQAIHWFDFGAFYREVRRVSKPGGILAVWGYGVMQFADHQINEQLQHFYCVVTNPYWDPERRYLDEAYQTIPFDLPEINIPETFAIEQSFTLASLQGYLNTWSAVKKMQQKTSPKDPVGEFISGLQEYWPVAAMQPATFPIHLRVGRVE